MTSLITFQWYKGSSQGFGQSTFKHDKERLTLTQLEDLRKQISEGNELDYIVVLNIIPLADEKIELDDTYEHAIKSMKEALKKVEKE